MGPIGPALMTGSSVSPKIMTYHLQFRSAPATVALVACLLGGCDSGVTTYPSSSMEPTIRAGKTKLKIDNSSGGLFKRWNIVAYKRKDIPGIYIARIVGLPNEQIEVLGNGISANGGPPISYDNIVYVSKGPYLKISNSKNGYYLLGDNSRNAIDSRYYGSISKEDIIGCVEIIP